MANSINKVILVGRAGSDPQLRYMASGAAQASFSLATGRSRKNPAGEWEEETSWHNIVAWRELAERMSTSIQKGDLIYLEGRIEYRQWENNEGQKQNRTEIIADHFILASRKERKEATDSGWESGDE